MTTTFDAAPYERRLSRMRERMLSDHPWFAQNAYLLRTEISDQIDSACTDGTYLKWSPQYLDSERDPAVLFTYAHEILHCTNQHMYRINGRDHELWNAACDYAINGLLIKAQVGQAPADILHDDRFDNMSAEQIYAILWDEYKRTGNKPQTPQSTGSFVAPEPPAADPTGGGQQPQQQAQNGSGGQAPAARQNTALDWQISAECATNTTKKAGTMPGGADAMVKAARGESADWRSILREFVEQTAPSDYSWIRPNRRYVANGLYLPGVVRENMPPLWIAIDNSGSISDHDLSVFAREIQAIMLELRPERVEIVFCDTRINKTATYAPDDQIDLTCRRGGGTYFGPVFAHIEQTGDIPAALIYLTDLENGDDPAEPPYPVLWVTSEKSRLVAPYGDTVRISFEAD